MKNSCSDMFAKLIIYSKLNIFLHNKNKIKQNGFTAKNVRGNWHSRLLLWSLSLLIAGLEPKLEALLEANMYVYTHCDVLVLR